MPNGFSDYRRKVYYSGATLYYALLGYPEVKKDLACAVYAFFHEVQETFYRSQDPLPIRIRLQWWRDEISNLFEGKPTHPITRLLAKHVEVILPGKEAFFEIINAFEACLDAKTLTEKESLDLIQKTIGNRERILALIFMPPKEDLFDLHQFGLAIGLTHFLKLFYKNFSTHLQILPIYSLDKSLQGRKVKSKELSPALRKELAQVLELAHAAFKSKPSLAFFKRRYKMAYSLVHKYEKKPERLLQRVELTPIQKLFLSL